MIPRVAGRRRTARVAAVWVRSRKAGETASSAGSKMTCSQRGSRASCRAVLLPDLASQLRRQRGEACKCHDLAGCGLAGSRGKEFEAQIRCG